MSNRRDGVLQQQAPSTVVYHRIEVSMIFFIELAIFEVIYFDGDEMTITF